MNILMEKRARAQQLHKAPTLRQLAYSAAQHDFKNVSIDERWQDQPATSFPEAPTAMMQSPSLRCYIWKSDDMKALTLIAWWTQKPLPWTITFTDGHLLLASVGNAQGPRFSRRQLTKDETRFLDQLRQNILRRM